MHEAMERNFAHNLAETTLVQPGFNRLRIGEFEIRATPPHEVAVVHPDDRTVFVTFSRGYPMGEREIREFFTQIYGDCVESIYMQVVQLGEQSLFSRLVFCCPSSIDLILNGEEKVKFNHYQWEARVDAKVRTQTLCPAAATWCSRLLYILARSA
ncbi:hypothetical protein RHMOL_Rhmol11G0109100 [Rhododendron molle]|uniref:Uncharacterized protein n=1 Tax=Rhododendron molle TaxID=49168 RepID=A0ACC0LR01_RHOML|nr:hypothetical protein RHMOL_Rhmol11G0109100 [Rhododendron molle]